MPITTENIRTVPVPIGRVIKTDVSKVVVTECKVMNGKVICVQKIIR